MTVPRDDQPALAPGARLRHGTRRGLLLAVVGIAVGGGLVLLAAGREWAHATVKVPAGTAAVLHVDGHSVASSLPAVGIAMIALAAAVLAASGVMRRIVGLVVLAIGATTFGVAITARGQVSDALERREVGAAGIPVHATANGWWLLVALGGLITLVMGMLTVVRGAQWSGLGAKYDAPAAAARPKDPAMSAWDALDRGEDPTDH
jgi:uncharacterized membrane protein (TIGR02234 family)